MVYNPSEPRDPLGKWMKAHGGNPKASLADNVKNLNYAEEHGAAVDTKNTPTAVIDQIAKTGRRRRNMLNQWPFAQLQEFTAYKAARNGVRILMVDPAYTSQKCNRCGYVDARNRNHARFDCLRCGHSDNADHNAALNIRDRAIQNLG